MTEAERKIDAAIDEADQASSAGCAAPLSSRLRVDEMADYLAHSIFAAGNFGDDKTQRIAFKGGRYPGKETDLGGFCRSALRDCIATAILERPRYFTENT